MSRAARVLASLFSAAALGACRGDQPEAGPALQTLRVVRNMHLNQGPLVLADEAGYFAAEGLKVDWVRITRGEEALVALLSGDVDAIATALHPGLLTAIARGGDVRIVAGLNVLGPECTYQAIVLRPGLSPEAAQRGIRKLHGSQDGATRYLAARMLATRGIDIDTLDTIRLPDNVLMQSLADGSVDAASLSEPLVTRIGRKGTIWLRSQDASPGFQWSAISFGKRLLHEHPEIGVRFLTAYRRGVALFQKGRTPENLERLERVLQEDRKILEESCWPTFRLDARPNMASVMDYQEWARKKGWLDQTVPLSQMWDSSFIVASDTALLRHTSHSGN